MEHDVASSQIGLITHDQALECGLTDKAIRHRVDSGRWVRRHIGVYAVAGAPRSCPACRYEVRSGNRLLGRVDFAFPEIRLAIEVDGYEHHASLHAFQHDRARQNELVAAGWTVLRFTWDDITRRPEQVATAILRVLGALRAG